MQALSKGLSILKKKFTFFPLVQGPWNKQHMLPPLKVMFFGNSFIPIQLVVPAKNTQSPRSHRPGLLTCCEDLKLISLHSHCHRDNNSVPTTTTLPPTGLIPPFKIVFLIGSCNY